jgi:hypothetical protein
MDDQIGRSKLRLRTRVLAPRHLPLAMLPAAGGLALIMHILGGVSLLAAYAVLAMLGVIVWLALLTQGSSSARRDLNRRVVIGATAGFLATIAYDTVRYALVTVLSWSVNPFHAWSLFGEALLGSDSSAPGRFAVGAVYHLMNGIGFGATFALIVRRPTWWLGVLWGLTLELVMALLYPRWMRIAQLQEFLTMSLLGHVAYGASLGALAGMLLRRSVRSSEDTPVGST